MGLGHGHFQGLNDNVITGDFEYVKTSIFMRIRKILKVFAVNLVETG